MVRCDVSMKWTFLSTRLPRLFVLLLYFPGQRILAPRSRFCFFVFFFWTCSGTYNVGPFQGGCFFFSSSSLSSSLRYCKVSSVFR
jgi:hypothetical protein